MEHDGQLDDSQQPPIGLDYSRTDSLGSDVIPKDSSTSKIIIIITLVV